MNQLEEINSFSLESIASMAKIISDKFGDKAIEILTLLQNEDLQNRSIICSKVKNSQPIVDKWLDSLECTTAIEAKKISNSYVYTTTAVGEAMLQFLKKFKEEKEV